MNTSEIQEAAKEAGFQFLSQWNIPACTVEAIQRFAAIIQRWTIDQCAFACEQDKNIYYDPVTTIENCTAAIRKLGEQ